MGAFLGRLKLYEYSEFNRTPSTIVIFVSDVTILCHVAFLVAPAAAAPLAQKARSQCRPGGLSCCSRR